MKRNPWLKWQIGSAAAIGIAVLFNEVKSSSVYANAVESHAGTAANAPQAAVQSTDPITNGAGTEGSLAAPRREGGRRQAGSMRHGGSGQGSAGGTAPAAPGDGSVTSPAPAMPGDSGSTSGSGRSSGNGSSSGSTFQQAPSSQDAQPAVPGTRTQTRTTRS
ncbi:hypothetical protein ACFFK0_22245 [Paenibacillus chartarius]|uniref:Uncharacterized protein n=1 Tax=Paenibacillus chartarius TaxID=747481 RepID=A0ABV6DR44_9BACL